MKIINSYVTGVDIWSTDLTTFSDTHKNRLITGIKLRCEGTLKDGSPVEYEVEVTQQERDVLVHVFDNILERFQLENGAVSEHHFEKRDSLADIKYEG